MSTIVYRKSWTMNPFGVINSNMKLITTERWSLRSTWVMKSSDTAMHSVFVGHELLGVTRFELRLCGLSLLSIQSIASVLLKTELLIGWFGEDRYSCTHTLQRVWEVLPSDPRLIARLSFRILEKLLSYDIRVNSYRRPFYYGVCTE